MLFAYELFLFKIVLKAVKTVDFCRRLCYNELCMVFYQYIISKEKEDKTMFKKNGLLKSPDSKPKEKYLLLFAVAFIGMMISVIP